MDAIMAFLSQYPIVFKIVMLMGTARLMFKPLMVAIQTYVDSTDDNGADNAKWEKIKAHWAYKAIAFVLDYVGSVKLPVASKS
jgi:hypothetical protein